MEIITFKQTPLELPVLLSCFFSLKLLCPNTASSKNMKLFVYTVSLKSQNPGPGEPIPFSCKLKNHDPSTILSIQLQAISYRLQARTKSVLHRALLLLYDTWSLTSGGQIRKPPFATDQCIISSDCESNA